MHWPSRVYRYADGGNRLREKRRRGPLRRMERTEVRGVEEEFSICFLPATTERDASEEQF